MAQIADGVEVLGDKSELAGVLPPSATVFRADVVRRPRGARAPANNGKAMNAFAGAAIAVPVKRSGVLTALVLFPDAIDAKAVGFIVAGCDVFACVAAG